MWSLSGDKQPSYKHFPAVGAFSLKFSIAPSGETTDRIKKVRGCKNGRPYVHTSSITKQPSFVWWGLWVARRLLTKKSQSVMLFSSVCRHALEYIVLYCIVLYCIAALLCEIIGYIGLFIGNAMKQCYFQNNYGVIACRKVCSCAHEFNFFVDPRIFP